MSSKIPLQLELEMSLASTASSDDGLLSPADEVEVALPAEIRSWWIYEFASSPVSGVSVSFFLPILLESLASSSSIPVVIFGQTVSPSSYVYYISAVSVVLQALVFISLGSFADYSAYRKQFLVITTILGSISCLCIWFVTLPELYWLGGLLFVLINLFYGTSQVFFNAFLPLLVKSHPDYLKAAEDLMEKGSESPQSIENSSELIKKADFLGNWLSGRAFMAGYLANVFLLVASFGIIFLMNQSTSSLKLCIGVSGAWWMLFSLITFAYVKPRPGPPFPIEFGSPIFFSFKKLYHTFQCFRQIPNTFIYLLSYFMFSDGHATINTTAILFGKEVLGMSAGELLGIAIISSLLAFCGNQFFLWLQKKTKFTSKQMNLLLLILLALIPMYAIIGFFTNAIGMHHKSEMFILGGYYGFLVGAVQSFSKVLFSELIPPGDESEFFSLYEVTDKGSSWFGPLMVGILKDYTGNMRYGFIILLVLLVLPVPFLLMTDMVKGKRDAMLYSERKRNTHEL